MILIDQSQVDFKVAQGLETRHARSIALQALACQHARSLEWLALACHHACSLAWLALACQGSRSLASLAFVCHGILSRQVCSHTHFLSENAHAATSLVMIDF